MLCIFEILQCFSKLLQTSVIENLTRDVSFLVLSEILIDSDSYKNVALPVW